ncbi:FAD-dependent oxidoreductase [Bacillus megaterium]|nr:FAD-dependent oxidoreductase [Priestia megaterium]
MSSAGITGGGIALDAVSRGMQTALVEMQDFAAGTSSRSTKLVHGGLRYLKQFEVKMVAEVGRERSSRLRKRPARHDTGVDVAADLSRWDVWQVEHSSVGLWLYDRLAGVKRAADDA